jgi:hypothetical protein
MLALSFAEQPFKTPGAFSKHPCIRFWDKISHSKYAGTGLMMMHRKNKNNILHEQ